MVAMTETAVSTPKRDRTTIVLVSGDGDMIPAIDAILRKELWKIEKNLWSTSRSNRFDKYEHEDRIKIRSLDDFAKRFYLLRHEI